MNLHPADIAKEIKTFSFFKAFGDDLLLQVSAMIQIKSFSKGTCILTEGVQNAALYFLRKGGVEVTLAGETISILDVPGDVFGEMSVITTNMTSTTVKAVADCECYYINSEDFAHVNPKDKDRFMANLYKIYCHILTQRLVISNEKARLFEILNREVHEAQSVIVKRRSGGKVLLVEPDKKKQFPIRMALGGTGLALDVVENTEAATKLLEKNKYDIVLCEADCIRVLKEVEEKSLSSFGVLLAGAVVQENLKILDSNRYVKNIISVFPEDRNATIRNVLTTLGKLLNSDLFGIDKYLMWGAEVQKKMVTNSKQRDQLRDESISYFKNIGIRAMVLDRVNTVLEEMLMNAIYDAPVDALGNHLFNHVSRREEVTLASHQQAQLSYGCDGVLLAISVADPFGVLTKEVVVDYLKSCYEGRAGSMNEHKGGAGRGFHQIVEMADITVFNVKKGVRTEVVSLFYLDRQKREDAPSFQYFFA